MNELGKVLVPGTLRSVADGGILAYAADIKDRTQNKRQSEINATIQSQIVDLYKTITNISGQHPDNPNQPDVPEQPDVTDNEYKWKVVTEQEYQNIEMDPKTLYFIIEGEYVSDNHSVLDGDTIKMTTGYSNGNISVKGTLENKKLILL